MGGLRAEVEAQIHLVVAEEHRTLEVEEEHRHLQEVEGERQMTILLRRPYLSCVSKDVNRETKGLLMKELKASIGAKRKAEGHQFIRVAKGPEAQSRDH